MTQGCAGPRGYALPIVAAGAALVWLGFLVGRTLTLTGGPFEYPLDDAYIHLAMAEGILSGGYGINPEEAAAASSSPLWPFLLAGFGAGRFTPLALNAVALGCAAWGWGLVARRAAMSLPFGVAVAAVGPIALDFPPVALLGMEHTAHLAMAFAVLLGLWRAIETGRGGWLLWLGAIAGPALRYEALALAEAAALILFLSGQRRLGLTLGVAAVLPLVAFAAFLSAQGLSPIPASVLVKLGEAGTGNGLLGKLAINLSSQQGMILVVLCFVCAALAFTAGVPAEKGILAAVTLALVAHLVLGRIGWAYRYENYALGLGVAAVVGVGLPRFGANTTRKVAAASALLIPLLALHWANLTRYGPQSARGLFLQQTQMARLVRDVWRGPVAVNDIGRVAYGNAGYVADLWGLSAPEAFALRMDPYRVQGWADPILIRHDIGLVLIYSASLPRAPGAGWTRLGALEQSGPAPYLAGLRVDVFAARPDSVVPLRAAIAAWAADLPQGAVYVRAESEGQ